MAGLEEEADAIRLASIRSAVEGYDRIRSTVDPLAIEFTGAAIRRGIAQPWLIETPYRLVVSSNGSWAWTFTRDSDFGGRLSVTVPVDVVRAQLQRGIWGRLAGSGPDGKGWGVVADWFWHAAVHPSTGSGSYGLRLERQTGGAREDLNPRAWRAAFVAALVNAPNP